MRVRRHSCTSGRPSDLGLPAREDTSLHKPASVPPVPRPWALPRLCFSRTSAREAVAASPHTLCPRPWSKAVVLLRKAPLDHRRRGRGDEDIAVPLTEGFYYRSHETLADRCPHTCRPRCIFPRQTGPSDVYLNSSSFPRSR